MHACVIVTDASKKISLHWKSLRLLLDFHSASIVLTVCTSGSPFSIRISIHIFISYHSYYIVFCIQRIVPSCFCGFQIVPWLHESHKSTCVMFVIMDRPQADFVSVSIYFIRCGLSKLFYLPYSVNNCILEITVLCVIRRKFAWVRYNQRIVVGNSASIESNGLATRCYRLPCTAVPRDGLQDYSNDCR
jgi:hypothetical protein